MHAPPESSPGAAPAPLLALDRASVTLAGRLILDAVSFALCPGQGVAVLGPNGAGKTTLLRLVRGDIPPDRDGVGSRRYVADGRDQSSPLGLRERFGAVSRLDWDFWRTYEGRITVCDAVCAGFFDTRLLHQPPTPEQIARARETLGLAGLADLEHASMAELSEGRLRAALVARAMAPRPLLLVLDEVLDGLDAENRRRALTAMAAAASSGAALVVTAHRAGDVPPGVTRAVVLEAGRVAAAGPLSEIAYFQAGEAGPQHAAGVLNPPAGAEAKSPPAAPCGPDVQGETARDGAPPLFALEHADVFLAGRQVLTDISWRVAPGEGWAVLGPNGAGKTTLLRLVMGDVHPALGGTVRRPGLEDVAGCDLRDIKTLVGFVSADLESAYPPHTPVADVVASGFFAGVGLYFDPTPEQAAAAAAVLAEFGLSDLAARPLRSLSTGQRRLVLMARAVVHAPRLLVLDEPFSSLDAAARKAAAAAVARTMARGAAVILVTHRKTDLLPGVTRVLRLEKGRARLETWPGAA
jgi:molybdate transport system ATP-binding protein